MSRRELNRLRLLAALFLVVLFAAGLLFSVSVAHAGPEGILQRLRADQFTGTDEALVANAKWVCARLSSTDENYGQVADKLRETDPIDHDWAVLFVADSVDVLCPAYRPRRDAPPGPDMHVGVTV